MPQKTVDDFYCPTCKSCPLITDYCPNCSRLEGSSGVIFDKVVYLEDQVRKWKENYEELERLARGMNNESFRLAKEVWDYDFKPNTPQFARVEAFYKAAYNKAIEDAARVAYGTGDEQLESQIRLLEMK